MTRLPRLPVGDARIVAGQLSPRAEPIRPRDEVRERCRAPPLDVLMRQREDDGSVSLLSGDDVIATAMPAAVQAQAPPAPRVEEAEIATRRGRGLRAPQVPDLLRLRDGTRRWPADLPGRVGDSPLIASPVDAGVRRSAACVGSALDCPSALAIESVDHRAQIVVLASLTVELRERPRAGERHVVAAWPVGSDGRKHHSASALYDATGRVLAVADASESSCETPPRSAAEPLDSLPIVLSRC